MKLTVNDSTTASLKVADDNSLGFHAGDSILVGETDPIFKASPAYGITDQDMHRWDVGSSLVVNGEKYPIVMMHTDTIDGVSGLTIQCDDGTPDGLEIFYPDINGFQTGAQQIIQQIPTKTSDLNNDSEFTDKTYVDGQDEAVIQQMPTKTSDLNNDSNFTDKTYVDNQDNAIRGRLFFGQVDDTSTATVFTAQIPGITEYYDGLAVMLKNGVVTSASGFTIDINGLGPKHSYNNMAAATADTTLFNIAYTMLFVYDSTRVEGGGWILYRGYDANTNTIGYQVRTNSYTLPMESITYRYRLLFRSADGDSLVPANNSTSTNATAKRSVCQDKIDPFGPIVYYGTTASVAAGSRPSAANLWQEYTLSLGYSFNRTGTALTLTSWKPVYLKCTPQTDGSAIMEEEDTIVQDKPTTNDGFIYIYLGVAYSATNIELTLEHPVYYHDGTKCRLYTG